MTPDKKSKLPFGNVHLILDRFLTKEMTVEVMLKVLPMSTYNRGVHLIETFFTVNVGKNMGLTGNVST